MPREQVLNAALATDVGRANQFVNGGFEINQRGLSSLPIGTLGLDRWYVAIVGTGAASASPDTTHQDSLSNQCLAVTVSSTSGNAVNLVVVEQKLEQFAQLRSGPLSVSFRVQAAIAASVRGFWNDGVTGGTANQFAATQAVGVGYTTYTFTFTPSPASTQLWVGLCLDTVTTFYVDNASCVIGPVAANYIPLHPADDLARCLRYYEVVGGKVMNIPQIYAYQATGTQFSIPVMFHAPKPVVPSVTKNGTWVVNNCNQPSAAPDFDMFILFVSVTALGAFNLQSGAANQTFVFEANP